MFYCAALLSRRFKCHLKAWRFYSKFIFSAHLMLNCPFQTKTKFLELLVFILCLENYQLILSITQFPPHNSRQALWIPLQLQVPLQTTRRLKQCIQYRRVRSLGNKNHISSYIQQQRLIYLFIKHLHYTYYVPRSILGAP